MASNNLKDAIRIGITVGPLYETPQTIYNEVKDLLAHEHARFINKLRKEGKPHETADYQIREFLEFVFNKGDDDVA